jgi:Ca2+-binding RTX toxin-like protein
MATITGTVGNDSEVGTAAADRISLLGGDDYVNGGTRNDLIFGGTGNDRLLGSTGDDTVFGGSGVDRLQGGSHDDLVFGGNGGDVVLGENGADAVSGGDGGDTLFGGNDEDRLDGGSSNDTMFGGVGDDRLSGSVGSDLLFGGAGDDILSGASGNDAISGGDGIDTAVYSGDRAAYVIGRTTSGAVTVQVRSGNEGIDVLSSVELLRFADGTVPTAGSPPGAIADSDTGANRVSDAAGNGTAVGITASATDPDGDAVCYTLSDSAGGRFAIDADTGIVTVANEALIDFATANSHAITVRASDALGLFSEKSFTIAVLEVVSGNRAPVTPGDVNSSANRVSEGTADGTQVGVTVKAQDPDGDSLTYSLTDSAGGRFAINASTGVVTLRDGSLIDFETATSHTIVARATDPDGLTSQQSFVIAVASATATQGPVVDIDATMDKVDENAATGTAVGITAQAIDPDGDRISYSLLSNALGRFAIDSGTGIVTVNDGTLIDYESSRSYSIVVQASDRAGNASQQTFVIAVNNLDETGYPTTGTDGDDSILATKGSDTIRGLDGNDYLWGSPDLGGSDDDLMFGGNGTDRVAGRGGNDIAYGDDDPDAATGGNDTVYGGSGVDTLYGGGGNDILGGDADNDTLFGGAGSDRIRGERGVDHMYGGSGNDIFVARDATDSVPGFGVDLIHDFDKDGNDRIDLSFIDTDEVTLDDQAFTFIGEAAFTGPAQVRYVINANTGDVEIQGNLDADDTPELVIKLIDASGDPITAGDFIL